MDDMMARMLMDMEARNRYTGVQMVDMQQYQPQQPQPRRIDGPLITIHIKDFSGSMITLIVPDNATIHDVTQQIKQLREMHDDGNEIRLFVKPQGSDGTNPIILDGRLDTCVPGGIQDGDTIEMLEVDTELTGVYGMGKRRSKKSAKKTRSNKPKKSVKKSRSKKTKKSAKKSRSKKTKKSAKKSTKKSRSKAKKSSSKKTK
uniref:Ubiquitin-like domain-containing protein n=1 Tax=viral metagenome TaxID=1070528 RepID=A0A6C0KI19_9ZZZZ